MVSIKGQRTKEMGFVMVGEADSFQQIPGSCKENNDTEISK